MRKQLPRLDSPLNADERLLYGIALRLDRVIELLEGDAKEIEPTVVEESSSSIDYSALTKNAIMEILDEREITYNSRDKKEILLELLEEGV